MSNQEVCLKLGQDSTLQGATLGFATDFATETLVTLGPTSILGLSTNAEVLGDFEGLVCTNQYMVVWANKYSDGGRGKLRSRALNMCDKDHIVFPGQTANWSTVLVQAQTAIIADTISTGLCLVGKPAIFSAAHLADIYEIKLIGLAGDLMTI